jgi:hypothetical protein
MQAGDPSPKSCPRAGPPCRHSALSVNLDGPSRRRRRRIILKKRRRASLCWYRYGFRGVLRTMRGMPVIYSRHVRTLDEHDVKKGSLMCW